MSEHWARAFRKYVIVADKRQVSNANQPTLGADWLSRASFCSVCLAKLVNGLQGCQFLQNFACDTKGCQLNRLCRYGVTSRI